MPEIVNGNKPADGGFLIVEDNERADFLRDNPSVAPFVKPFLCADQYLNGEARWVLWLKDAPPNVIRENPGVRSRVESVRMFRLKSPKESTRRRASVPAHFDQVRQPSSPYVVVPRHSSENRTYVPFGYFGPEVIIGDSCTAILDATPYHFGVISSMVHMAWMRAVCGRLESRYRYSNKIVYNNFPWPTAATPAQRAAVESAARAVLAAREPHLPPRGMSTLADLYDPLSMPAELAKAHATLDRAVEKCYRPAPFHSDRERVEHLFRLSEQLLVPLLPAAPKTRQRRSQNAATSSRPRRGRTPGLPSAGIPPSKSTHRSVAPNPMED